MQRAQNKLFFRFLQRKEREANTVGKEIRLFAYFSLLGL